MGDQSGLDIDNEHLIGKGEVKPAAGVWKVRRREIYIAFRQKNWQIVSICWVEIQRWLNRDSVKL